MRLKFTVKVIKGKKVDNKAKWTSSHNKYATDSSVGVMSRALKDRKDKNVIITALTKMEQISRKNKLQD